MQLSVLVVDDNPVDRIANKRLLWRANLFHTVDVCDSGEAALDLLRHNASRNVDLLLVDVHMPGMDGFDFLGAAVSEFGDAFARAVVIMLTSPLGPAERDRVAGFLYITQYIAKPLTDAAVAELVKMLGQTPGS